MVRTGDRCVTFGGSRSSAKKGGGKSSAASGSSTPKSKGSSSRANSSIGGNPVCPRETPEWQKPITSFFLKKDPAESSSGISEKGSRETLNSSECNMSCSNNKTNDDADDALAEQTQSKVLDSKKLPAEKDLQEITSDNINTNNTSNGIEEKPGTSSLTNKTTLEENKLDHSVGNGSKCITPTSEKKRKSTINILTPKRIQSHS
ncbi:PCNA-associated factor-like [Coccinella septempunctata]|uniref:PCNA-associated factor-like n=1 Tax=Coccinella septempunctata TaxID=41139 RepID=UPI001D07C131|nr:PCNA-associated factor-like [Coccinella septempunctata]